MSLLPPWPRSSETTQTHTDIRPTGTPGTLLTADSTSHTLGTKVELFSATTHDTYWVRIALYDTANNTTQTDALCNIYVGAGGSEQAIIPNLVCGWAGALNTSPKTYEFPLFIRAGSRIAADVQGLISSETVRISMELCGGGQPTNWCGTGVEAIGISTAASQGTSVTPGGASEGSFTDIGAPSRDLKYILPMIHGGMTDTSFGGSTVALDIGVGGSLYRDLHSFLFTKSGSNESISRSWSPVGRFALCPAGTTLQVRLQDSGTAETQHDVALYGVY
jgi:hypothetical protein